MTIVTETPDIGNVDPQYVAVEVYLAGEDGERLSPGTEIELDEEDGSWTMELEPNASIVPAGTVYARRLRGYGISGTPTYAIVPDEAGPVDWTTILTDASDDPVDTPALEAHKALKGLPGTHLPADTPGDQSSLKFDAGTGRWVTADPVLDDQPGSLTLSGQIIDPVNLKGARGICDDTGGLLFVAAWENDRVTCLATTDGDPEFVSSLKLPGGNVDGTAKILGPRCIDHNGESMLAVGTSLNDAIYFVDTTRPGAMQNVTSITDPKLNGLHRVRWRGRYLFASGLDFFVVIDVVNPANPTPVITMWCDLTGADLYGFDLDADVAWVAASTAERYYAIPIDNKKAGAVLPLGSIHLPGTGPHDIDIDGVLAYTANSLGDSISIFDASDPTNPQPRSSFPHALLNGAHTSHKLGKYLVVCSQVASGFVVLDVSDPDAVSVVGDYTGDDVVFDGVRAMCIRGTRIYGASFTSHAVGVVDLKGLEIASMRVGSVVADEMTVRSVLQVGGLKLPSGYFDPAGTAADLVAGRQPLSAELTSIAALVTQPFGRSLLEQVSAPVALATLGGVPVVGTHPTAATLVQSSRVTADAFARFQRQADGRHEWGTGALAPDTFLARTAAGVLSIQTTNAAAQPAPTLELYNPFNANWAIDDLMAGIDMRSADNSGGGAGVKGFVRLHTSVTSGTSVSLRFGTADNASANAVERMRIDHNGLVGIGVVPTGSNGYLQLPAGTTVATGGISWGTDTSLYRSQANTIATPGSLSIGTSLSVTGATSLSSLLTIERAAATNPAMVTRVPGDPVNRYTVRNDGLLSWSDGALAIDTTLGRISAGVLFVSGAFQVSSEVTARLNGAAQSRIGQVGPASEGGVAAGSASDVSWYRAAADLWRTPDAVTVDGALTVSGGAAIRAIGVVPGTHDQLALRSQIASIVPGDLIGGVAFCSGDPQGADGQVAAIRAIAHNTHTAITLGTRLDFLTTNQNSLAPTLKMTLSHEGRLEMAVQGVTGGLLVGGDVALYRLAAGVAGLTGGLTATGAVIAPSVSALVAGAGTTVYQASVAGDGTSRFGITNVGVQSWGDGTLARDTTLGRLGAGILATNGAMTFANATANAVAVGFSATGVTAAGLAFGSAYDVNLYRGGANLLATDDELRFNIAGVPLFFNNAAQWQATVGAAGAAAALPATPSKYLKVKDETGTTFVVPAFLAA